MKIIQQDMTELRSGILFHQVNCKGIMGAGIAAALATKFHGLEKAYKEFCQENPPLLGKVFLYRVKDGLYIANIFGQDNISTSRRQTSYDATVEAFESIIYPAHRSPLAFILESSLPLYFPWKIGCGLGGGNWNIYSSIIEENFGDRAIICQHHE